MTRRQLLTVFIVTMLVTLTRGLTATPAAVAQSINDFTEIEWVDLGEQAWYPREAGISEGQSVVVNDKLYVFGGYAQCCIPIRDANVFDPSTNTWAKLADLPQGTTHTGIATDGTDIYLAGGYVENADQTYRIVGHEKFWRYNVGLNTYTAMPDLPKKASTGQLAYLNGKLHYIGGTTPDTQIEDLPDHFVFDLEAYKTDPNTTWVDITATAPLPNPRQHAGIAVLDGKIYYVAGQHYHNNDLVPQSDVHRYDPETNMWTQVASLPVERNHMSNTIVVLGGRIIVMGGQYTHETPNDEVFAYDPAADAWTELTSLPIEQFSAIGGVINGEIYYGTGDKGHSGPERRRMRKGIPIFSEAVTATPDLTATATPMVTGEQPTSESTAQPTQTSTPASTPIAGGELLINGSFEAATTGWKGKSLSQDKVKCDKPDKSFAYTGDCAFLFKGGADENARLQQKVDLSTRAFNGGDTLTISFYANVKQSAVNAKVRVMVKFNDATEKIRKEVALAQTSGYQPFSDTLGLPVGNVAAIKVQILHNSPGGKLFIDDLRLNHNALNTTTLLPLP